MVARSKEEKEKGMDPTHLSKIWIIDIDDSKRTLDVTTQTSVWSQDPILGRSYGTNDHMLWYNCIQE